MIKSTAIDPSMIDEQGIYYHKGVAKVYLSEKSAIYDIKHDKIKAGDILVIIGVGPSGTGMEETYQVTSALKHLSYGKACFVNHRCTFLGRFYWRVHRPCGARSAGRRPHR